MRNLNIFLIISAISGFWTNSISAQNTCFNVALNKPASASSTWSIETPVRAFDGDLTTNWSADQHTGWIQVDLQNTVTVDSLKLYVNQYNAGNTIHEIFVSEDLESWTLVKTLSENTINNQILTVKFNPGLSNVRGVKINTPSSNSWVAWYEIQVFAIPYKPIITQEGTVLRSSSAINNQWYLNGSPIPGATAQTFTTVISSDSYQVGITNGNDCVSMSDMFAVVITETDILSNNLIKIYPNPTTDNVIVEGISNAKIDIFNLQGQSLKNMHVNGNNADIDLSDISSGIYTLKISTIDGIFVQKIIKN